MLRQTTWQRAQPDHLNCSGTECSESAHVKAEKQRVGTAISAPPLCSQTQCCVCRCFVYIRILRHAACWLQGCVSQWLLVNMFGNTGGKNTHETGHFPVCFLTCFQTPPPSFACDTSQYGDLVSYRLLYTPHVLLMLSAFQLVIVWILNVFHVGAADLMSFHLLLRTALLHSGCFKVLQPQAGSGWIGLDRAGCWGTD